MDELIGAHLAFVPHVWRRSRFVGVVPRDQLVADVQTATDDVQTGSAGAQSRGARRSESPLTGVCVSGSFQTQSKQRGIVDPMLSIWGQQLIVNEDTDQ